MEAGNVQMLSSRQRRQLRALGHHLKPVVMVGKEGVTDALLTHLDRELEIHELIKVKVLEAAPEDPDVSAQQMAEHSGAHLAQVLGRTALLYRARKEDPEIDLG